MKIYNGDYLILTKYYDKGGYGTISTFDPQEHLNAGNKLFRVILNPVYHHYFYGEILYKITGMNFFSHIGCT